MPSTQHILVTLIVLAAPWCMVWMWRRDTVRPGSVRRLWAAGRMRDPAAIGAGVWLAAGVATYIAAILGAAVAAEIMGVRREPGSGPAQLTAAGALADVETYVFAGVVGVLCAAMLVRVGKFNGVGARKLGLEVQGGDAWRGLGGLLLVLPLCVVAGAAVSLIAGLVQRAPEPLQHSGLRQMVEHRHTWYAWVKVMMAIVGAPVMEELVYRVFVQSAVISALARLRWSRQTDRAEGPSANAGDVFWGIVMSTAVFVLPHAPIVGGPAGWSALPSLTILGVGLGVVYERTRSPLAPIVMHAGFNAANVAAAMLTAAAVS